MDNLIKVRGEDRVKKFLRTLSPQERIELIEEVRRMLEMRNLNSNNFERKKEKPSTEFNLMDGYY